MHRNLVRGLAAVGAVAMVATGTAVALAAAPPPTAALSGGTDLLSGKQTTLQFVVTNTPADDGSAPAYVNTVRIVPPTSLTIDAAAAEDWTAKARSDRSVQLSAQPTNPLLPAGIAPGMSAMFAVTTTASAVAEDLRQTWKIATSTNGGSSFTIAAVPAGSTLTSTVRVLEVVGTPTVGFVRPGKATAGQDTLSVRYTVRSHSTDTLEIEPTVSGTAGDGLLAPSATPTVLLSGQEALLDVPVVFGDSGSGRTLSVSATNGTSSAIAAATAPYDVQQAASFALGTATGDALAPAAASSGSTPEFTLGLAQPTGPSVTLDPTTTLSFAGEGRTPFEVSGPLTTTTTTSGSTTGLAFPAVTVPGTTGDSSQDGAYSATLGLVGVDANGATVEATVAPAGTLLLDNVAPSTEVAVELPHRAGTTGDIVGDDNQPFVAKSGDTLTVSGPVRPVAGATTLDTAAEVACTVVYLANSKTMGGPQSLPCTNEDGGLTGQVALAPVSGADSARVDVTTTDEASNSSTTSSEPFLLDLVAPVIQAAQTGCDNPADTTACPNQYASVRLELTEPVSGVFLPADFVVRVGEIAIPVAEVLFDGSASTFGDTLALRLGKALVEDDEPTIAFQAAPRLPSQPAPADQAGAALTAAAGLTAADRIAPVVPVFSKVDNKTVIEGAYYTSTSDPDLLLTQWSVGHRVDVYRESGMAAGLDVADDVLVCSGTNVAEDGQDPTTSARQDTCTPGLGTLPAEGEHVLYAVATDPSGNTSRNVSGTRTFATAKVVLDTTAPKILTAVADASGITITFDGPIVSGRDNASDWTVTNGAAAFVVASVTNSSPTTRRLSIEDGDWTGAFDLLVYLCESDDENDWYTDRADNRSRDAVFKPEPAV